MKPKTLIIIIFILIIHSGNAQNFKTIAQVDTVPARGFYKILIPAEVIAQSNHDYGDIRLLDSEGKETPYLLESEQPANEINGFKEYQLLENIYDRDKRLTRVVIRNNGRIIISGLNVIVRNAQISKEYTLKGSDNQKDWFIIQKGTWDQLSSFNATSERIEMNFPKVDYEYLEISVNDAKRDPVQILSVGYFDSYTIRGQYSEVPVKDFTQTDSSDHKTYLKLKFDHPFEISRLDFKISGPELYLRDCYIGTYFNEKNKILFKENGFCQLSSSAPNTVIINNMKPGVLTLIIDNKDNQPLHFEKVRTYQLNKYLIAKLDPELSYTICTGNPNLHVPEYDLQYFTNSIPRELPLLRSNILQVNSQHDLRKSHSFNPQLILWIVIILVMLTVGFFSVRMLYDMKKSRNNQ